MKINIGFSILIALLMSSCNTEPDDKPKAYWEVDTTFDAPDNWHVYNYANAFSIAIPDYMYDPGYDIGIDPNSLKGDISNLNSTVIKNSLDEQELSTGEVKTVTFKPDKKIKGDNNYSRIYIEFHKGVKGSFMEQIDMPYLDDKEGNDFCKQLIQEFLGDGKLLCVLKKDWIFLPNVGAVLDICYRRMGYIKNAGSVTVHLFLIKDSDKMIIMSVSHSTKFKDDYKNLFNIVSTIKWTNNFTSSY